VFDVPDPTVVVVVSTAPEAPVPVRVRDRGDLPSRSDRARGLRPVDQSGSSDFSGV